MQRTNRVRALRWSGLTLLGFALLAIAACSGPVNTDNAVMVRDISVTPSLLQEGEVAIVEVLVTNSSGDPLPNRTVYLAAEPNTSGTLNNVAVQTDANGVATVLYTATEAGSVTISARAEGGESSINANVVIEAGGITSGEGQIVLNIAPGLIQADGISTAMVSATVADKNGSLVADSTPVRFTAGEKFTDNNGDGYWTVNVDELIFDTDGDDLWDPIGSIGNVAYTTNGVATTIYTAGHLSGLVYIKATIGSPGHHTSQDISLSLTANDSINTMSLTPDWQQIQVRGTGGIEWARVLAQAFDAYGNPAPEGLPVDFNITAGPGGGETINGDPIGPVTVYTNSMGQAAVVLNAGTIPGTVRLRARSGTVVSTATQVTVRSGPAAYISMGAADCNVASWELVNVTNLITATVVDGWGNEVADSTAVHFGTEQGMIEGETHTQDVKTFRGVAQTYWHSGAPKNDGYVFYWCETSGGTVADTTLFIESGPAASGTFLQWPDTLDADGVSHGEVVVEVLDVNGVYMDSDTPIDLKADFGAIGGGLLNDGCHSSIFIGEYFSQTLEQDYEYTIPDSGVGAIATISGRSGGYYGFNGGVQVVLATGAAYSKRSSIDGQSSVTYGISVPVEVVIKDRAGNPLGGHLIELVGDGSGGTVTGGPRYTDSYGIASGFTFTATTNKTVTTTYLTANDLDPNYGGIVLSMKVSLGD